MMMMHDDGNGDDNGDGAASWIVLYNPYYGDPPELVCVDKTRVFKG